jgi:hypothetical protein
MSTAPFLDVLRHELALVKARRQAFAVTSAPPAPPATTPLDNGDPPAALADAQQTSTFGVCFSGGGIRSATFNLGMLQGLAEKGLLPWVDYLSTVSGGGYIGSWLHGVISRAPKAGDTPTAREQMGHAARVLLRGVDSEPGPPDRDPITFLRTYSNYLAPRPGLFSADTWTIGFIWLRNVLLNQLILVPAIAAAVVAALLALFVYQLPLRTYSSGLGFDLVATVVASVCLCVAAFSMARNLRPIARQSVTSGRLVQDDASIRAARSVITVPVVFAAMVALGSAHFDVERARWLLFVAFPFVMAFIQLAGGFVECYRARRNTGAGGGLVNVAWISVTSGAVAALLITWVWRVVMGWPAWFHLAFGPPLVGVCFIASVMLLIGLMGADYPDAAREWTARIGSMLGIATAGWVALFGLMVFGPWGVAWIISNFEKSGLAAVAAWALTTAGGVLAGRSPRTANGTDPEAASRVLEILANIAPTVFLIGYIILIAAGVHAIMPFELTAAASVPAGSAAGGLATVSVNAPPDSGVELKITPQTGGTLERAVEPVRKFEERYPSILAFRDDGLTLPVLDTRKWTQLDWALVLLFGTVIVAVVASRRNNINEFSLQHFYKNRLVRCYLGASQAATRKPHPLTGFDPLDDFPLSTLDPRGKDPYFGPYPIINAALNLNAGSELATQERKAASFVFTPGFCGFHAPSTPGTQAIVDLSADGLDRNGYRETGGYANGAGPDVGTAIGISGAAANPNWGYHTSGPMAFLLTVFNARLGWWLGNPRSADASRHSGPKFALKYLFAELLGQTTGASQFINLSDGGHVVNLGLYELIRRRTRFIIVCDPEDDHGLTFGSLGAAIRRCRADFGVEIDINPEPIQIKHEKFSTAHCVVGTIVYPERETAFRAGLTGDISGIREEEGPFRCRAWLLYLKSSLTGDEPADVTEYHAQHREFPHESTADQFFSESQFESYRRLGYHVLRSAFEGIDMPQTAPSPANLGGRYPLVPMFQELTRKWYAPIPVTGEAATRLALAYVELMKSLAATPGLKALYEELVSGQRFSGPSRTGAPSPEEVSAGMELMQLVQNVYTEFGFDNAFNRANPRNSGWTSVFRKWLRSPILAGEIWPLIASDYHPLFQQFVNRDLARPSDDVPERP